MYMQKGYVIISFGGWELYDYYMSPNTGINEYEKKVDKIATEIRYSQNRWCTTLSIGIP